MLTRGESAGSHCAIYHNNEPPSPPQPQTRKRCLKQRDEGEPPQPPSNLRLTAPSHQKQSLSAGANSSDSDVRTLPPHKNNPKCGLAVAEKYLPNGKFSGTRFQGGIARGSGGCFSPAVGKEASYFGESKNVEDLNVNEGHDGDCEDVDDDNGDVRKHIFSDAQALRATSTFMVEQMANTEAAMAVGPALMTVFLVFGGYYVNAENTPIVFRWIPRVSFIKWAFQGLCINEFKGLQFGHQQPIDIQSGEQVDLLKNKLGFDDAD